MAEIPVGTFTASLAILAQKGVRYSSVIDLGCADGHFFVDNFLRGLFRDCVPVNIDADALYEPSLKAILETFGGHYRISAVSDETGELALMTSIHPYWNSLRAPNDLYWERINNLRSDVRTVPSIRLDDLADELKLEPPYLLKLDIQGAEVQALRGAKKVLRETNVVICESDIDDFQAINSELVGAGFNLFDITAVNRMEDQSLGWFYPVYINSRLSDLMERHFWHEASNHEIIQMQIDRRQRILTRLAEVLPQIRASKSTRHSK